MAVATISPQDMHVVSVAGYLTSARKASPAQAPTKNNTPAANTIVILLRCDPQPYWRW